MHKFYAPMCLFCGWIPVYLTHIIQNCFAHPENLSRANEATLKNKDISYMLGCFKAVNLTR